MQRLGRWSVSFKNGHNLVSGGLYRVRLAGARIEKLDDCWAAPSTSDSSLEKLPAVGRCNAPGQSTLYLSNCASTALRESRAIVGAKVYLVRYRAKSAEVGLEIANLVSPVGNQKIEFDQAATGFDYPMSMTASRLYDDVSFVSHRILAQFLRQLFVQPPAVAGDERSYWLSAALANCFFCDGDTQGIHYPSVQDANGTCLAFRDEVAREELEVASVSYGEVLDARARVRQPCAGAVIARCGECACSPICISHCGQIQEDGGIAWAESRPGL